MLPIQKPVFEKKNKNANAIRCYGRIYRWNQRIFYIPNTLMRWEKPNPYAGIKGNVKRLGLAYPTFYFEIGQNQKIKSNPSIHWPW